MKLTFIESCLRFKELYPEQARNVSMYLILDNSDAIEILFYDGCRKVYDANSDFLVTVKDA